jgi:DNA-binding NarL/FixJ family response regulator
VVGEADCAGAIRAQLNKLDMTMPGLNGVDLIRLLREERPALPILVLSMYNEGQIVARAIKAGAAGYVLKDSEPEILLEAIRKLVVVGGKYIDPALVDTLVFNNYNDDNIPQTILTKRELQILKLFTAGKPLGEIAGQLHLSPKTVSTHKMRLMQKINIDNNAELIRYASKYGLDEV